MIRKKHAERIEKDAGDENLELPTSFWGSCHPSSVHSKHHDSDGTSAKSACSDPWTIDGILIKSNTTNFNRYHEEHNENDSTKANSQSFNEPFTIVPSMKTVRIETSGNNVNDNTI